MQPPTQDPGRVSHTPWGCFSICETAVIIVHLPHREAVRPPPPDLGSRQGNPEGATREQGVTMAAEIEAYLPSPTTESPGVADACQGPPVSSQSPSPFPGFTGIIVGSPVLVATCLVTISPMYCCYEFRLPLDPDTCPSAPEAREGTMENSHKKAKGSPSPAGASGVGTGGRCLYCV